MKKILSLFSLSLFLTACMAQDPAQNDTSQIDTSKTDIEISYGEMPRVTLRTSMGDIVIKLYEDDAPKTVMNFIKLTEEEFYNGTLFHRVIPDFMIQGGDPLSREEDWTFHGTGGPGYTFEDEINDRKLVRGSFAMANSGPNTNGSQFFIVTATSTPWLDGLHTNFGEVVSGMDVVDAIQNVEANGNAHPLEDVVLKQVWLQETLQY